MNHKSDVRYLKQADRITFGKMEGGRADGYGEFPILVDGKTQVGTIGVYYERPRIGGSYTIVSWYNLVLMLDNKASYESWVDVEKETRAATLANMKLQAVHVLSFALSALSLDAIGNPYGWRS